MKKAIKLYKEIGETPLECVRRFQDGHSEYKGLPMTYAGRLDPMAEGILLVLTGEECKQKEKYLGLDKEYEVEILFGFATDTYDVLGKITEFRGCPTSPILRMSDIRKLLQTFVGKFTQDYPAYSSKLIKRSMFSTMVPNIHLPEVMPTKEVEIYSIKFLGSRNIKTEELLKQIERKISKVKGDFRQKQILALWRKNLKNGKNKYQIITIKVKCSSGTYMRSLAQNLGRKLGIPALAFSIKRTKIILSAK